MGMAPMGHAQGRAGVMLAQIILAQIILAQIILAQIILAQIILAQIASAERRGGAKWRVRAMRRRPGSD